VDTEAIERLLALMNEGGLTELVYEKDDFKVKLSRRQDSGGGNTLVLPSSGAMPAAPAPPPAALAAAVAPVEEQGVEMFRSPMVGTFYSRSSPESDILVKPGDQVGFESVICILEAMKVFNEIQAEMNGEIVSCLVQDGEPVEFDQPLFKIRKN
jgi:acetyl-CoA carboxylase biotin carboxyl carrier protein